MLRRQPLEPLGHEDHIGALPYVLQAVNAPVHATPLTLGLIKLKLEEHDLVSKTQLVTHHPGDVVKAGCFSVEFIHVNHSIADAVAFAIHTPVGTVIMTGDFKIDPTSEDGMTDLGRFGMLGKEGVYALLCDSTNVERQGYTPSESVVSESLDRHFKGCKNRIIVTTFASNMHRIQAVFNIAHRHGRKVAVTGRSMENILKVATELDYLHLPENTLVDLNQIKSIPKDKLVWEEDNRVLGYCYAGRAFERAAYAWNAEISCYLAHEAQHRGIGRQLYARVEELLCRQGCRKVFAVVTSANEPSLAFHRAIGYRDAACFRQVGYKLGRWYDVTWLEKSLCPLGEPSEFPISWKEVL